jgi:hypothetical protein
LLTKFPIAGLPLGVPHDLGRPMLRRLPAQQLPLFEITFFSLEQIEEVSESMFQSAVFIFHDLGGSAKDHLEKLKEIYKVSHLHIPGLVYLEERVQSSGS